MIRIALPDGSKRSIRCGTGIRDLATAVEPRLAPTLLCVTVDGELRDLRDRLTSDCEIGFHTASTPEGRAVLCHTAAHIAAHAVKRLFPDIVLGMGPASARGFVQDIVAARPLTEAETERIEAEMARIIDEDLPIERIEMSRGDARSLLIRLGEVLKLEILEEIGTPAITLYKQGDYIDLCRGPHAPSTGFAPRARLTGIDAATWRDDPHAEVLTRIRGTVPFAA